MTTTEQTTSTRRVGGSKRKTTRGKPQSDTYRVYADGSSLNNPGPAGWAVLITRTDGHRQTLCGSSAKASNNQMELTAAIEALRALPKDACGTILCDSEYVVKGVTEWRKGWEARGWRNSKGQLIANADLWRTLFALADDRPGIRFGWVRGHAGDEGNAFVDMLARTEAEKVRAGLPPVVVQEAIGGQDGTGMSKPAPETQGRYKAPEAA